MPCAERPRFLRDCLSAWQAASDGVTAQTNATRKKYWALWEKYASTAGISPCLDKTVSPIKRDLVTGAFAARVRTSEYGRGQRIRVGGVSESLADVSKNIELAGQPSALYRGDNKYQLFFFFERARGFPTCRSTVRATSGCARHSPSCRLYGRHHIHQSVCTTYRMPHSCGFLFPITSRRIYQST